MSFRHEGQRWPAPAQWPAARGRESPLGAHFSRDVTALEIPAGPPIYSAGASPLPSCPWHPGTGSKCRGFPHVNAGRGFGQDPWCFFINTGWARWDSNRWAPTYSRWPPTYITSTPWLASTKSTNITSMTESQKIRVIFNHYINNLAHNSFADSRQIAAL